MPWCSLSPPGGVSSLTGPRSLESLIGSGSKWRSSYLGTGNDRREFDVVAGSGGSSCSSCSSVSKSYHFVPLYHPPDPKPFSLSSSVVQGVAWYVIGLSAPVGLVPPQLRPRRRRPLVEALVPPRLRPRRRRRLVGARYRWTCPRLVVPVLWSDVWLIRFGSWIPS